MGSIDWKHDPEDKIIQKITELYHAGVDFNMVRPLYNDQYTHDQPSRVASAVDLAAAYSTPKVIELLIDGGADISLKSTFINHLKDVYTNALTPLHWAAWNGKTENVKCLIKAGSKKLINEQTKDAESCYLDMSADTALHIAAYMNHTDTVKALVAAGADVNKQNENGETALHLVIRGAGSSLPGFTDDNGENFIVSHVASAKALIEAGADINIKNDKGETVLDLLNEKETPNKGAKWYIQTQKEIKKLIENADKIRAEYLAKHPESSLQQTLGDASQKPNKMSLIKNPKTR